MPVSGRQRLPPNGYRRSDFDHQHMVADARVTCSVELPDLITGHYDVAGAVCGVKFLGESRIYWKSLLRNPASPVPDRFRFTSSLRIRPDGRRGAGSKRSRPRRLQPGLRNELGVQIGLDRLRSTFRPVA
jgi:hypothetical protein